MADGIFHLKETGQVMHFQIEASRMATLPYSAAPPESRRQVLRRDKVGTPPVTRPGEADTTAPAVKSQYHCGRAAPAHGRVQSKFFRCKAKSDGFPHSDRETHR